MYFRRNEKNVFLIRYLLFVQRKRRARLTTIINSSNSRQDNHFNDDTVDPSTIFCHKTCYCSYTSKSHLHNIVNGLSALPEPQNHMLEKRILTLSAIGKKLVGPYHLLGGHLGFWLISFFPQSCPWGIF